jgi:gluconate:H+ symporter, GntP family
MILGLHPMVLLTIASGLFVLTHFVLRWPLPLAFIGVAGLTALLGDFGIPFRHLVEGGFGFLNLLLALFAGAFFGHMMRTSQATDRAAVAIVSMTGGRVFPVLLLAGLPIFVIGMFVGLAGVAVLAGGVFAVPALRRIGFDGPTTAAFIAVMATAGMIAPPMNVPAMLIADGTNMPWVNVSRALLALAVPYALFGLVWFTWVCGPTRPATPVRASEGGLGGLLPLAVIVAIWVAVRLFPSVLVDPSSALILVIGGLVALPRLARGDLGKVVYATFTGTPLLLAAVLVAVGVMVQIMTLTGVRGWLIVSTMSLESPWIYVGLVVGTPLLGGPLTSMVVADVVGVPAAFAFIGQNMILNVAALSAIAAIAEFVPPTNISAGLACYVVGEDATVGGVARRSWAPLAFLAAISVAMLIFAKHLVGVLV